VVSIEVDANRRHDDKSKRTRPLAYLWSFSRRLRDDGGLAPDVGLQVDGRGVAMLGSQNGRGPFAGRRRGGVTRPLVALEAVEGLLVLRGGDALGVDGGVELRLRLASSPCALMDHRDGDVAGL